MADYLVETGKGHYITQEEVLEILERAERNGFVHQITNIDGEDKIFAICNCAPGVCNALRTSQLFNTPNMSRSAYRAHVEAGKCVACGQCVEVCPVGAAKLGQKLCTKQGEISYPKSLLPDTENGDRTNGIRTIGIMQKSTVMTPVLRHVKQPVLLIFRYRVTSKWLQKAVIWMR